MSADLGLRFTLRNEVAIEDFGERSLVLLCDSLQLRELNAAARLIVGRLDGRRTVKDIAEALAAARGVPASEIRAVVLDVLLQLEVQGVVRRVVKLGMERPEDMNAAKYLVDPDVSFRPEDDGGGILYSADTDVLEVINPTAAEIWKFLAAPRTPAEVAAHLLAVCDGADRTQVERDVRDFLETMQVKGFIGTVAEPA